MAKDPKDPNLIPLHRSIKTVDGAHEYPVDFVREFFINSDKSIEDTAIQLNLPISVVQLYARQGLESWHKMQSERMEQRMRLYAKLDTASLLDTHAWLEDGHFLTLVQYKGMQEFLKQYVIKYGHLFAVDDQGEIRKDLYGMPICLPLPNGPKQFMAIEGFLKLKEGTKQAMNFLHEQSKNGKNKDGDVIDVEEDEIFREGTD